MIRTLAIVLLIVSIVAISSAALSAIPDFLSGRKHYVFKIATTPDGTGRTEIVPIFPVGFEAYVSRSAGIQKGDFANCVQLEKGGHLFRCNDEIGFLKLGDKTYIDPAEPGKKR